MDVHLSLSLHRSVSPQDVQEMKELVSSRAKEQFAKAQEQYKQLGAAYGETKASYPPTHKGRRD
jgi:hypothetical protein